MGDANDQLSFFYTGSFQDKEAHILRVPEKAGPEEWLALLILFQRSLLCLNIQMPQR